MPDHPTVERFTVVPASYLFCLRETDRDTEVLLQLRQNTGYMDGHWGAGAAGHVEQGEDAEVALHREALEELGITGIQPTFEFTMQRTQSVGPGGANPIDERVDFFFTSRSWTGQPSVQEPHKVADLRWWPLAELPPAVVPHEAYALTHLGTATRYLTFGF